VSNARGAAPRWALVLGVSSGFGAECGVALAGAGYEICGVHLDRKASLPQVEQVKAAIEGQGRRALFFNVNAADPEKRTEVLDRLEAERAEVGVLLHSLAFGALKPFVGADAINEQQMDMTLTVMAHSLVYWTQDAYRRGLLRRGARVFSMTSSGSTRAIASYGAVSAAKAALESHIRQLAFELAPLGVTANAIRAGVTDTPALRRIPGGPELHQRAMERNPSGRATTTEDVAKAIAVLADERLYWMTGNVIGIDGGEELST
jgi:enoyl-[acyl-carrier protein] reductase III